VIFTFANNKIKKGEAYNLLQVIKWVPEMRLDNIIFELDLKVVPDNFFFFFNKELEDNFNQLSHDLSFFFYL